MFKHQKTFGLIYHKDSVEYVRTPTFMRDGRLVSAPNKREVRYLDSATHQMRRPAPGAYLLIVNYIGPVPTTATLHTTV